MPAARSTVRIDLPPASVWAVLADPWRYPDWVVGARTVRAADPGWPGLGTVFHHTVGLGPLALRDHTQVLEVDPPRRLVLRTHARPLGTGHVQLTLAPVGAGCEVVMEEGPGGPLTRLAWTRLAAAITRRRNAASLRRLKRLVELERPRGAS